MSRLWTRNLTIGRYLQEESGDGTGSGETTGGDLRSSTVELGWLDRSTVKAY